MQEVDFFAESLEKFETTAGLFYLADDLGKNEIVSFHTSVKNPDKFVNVKNPETKDVVIIPLDHNLKVFKENGRDQESLCDYLLRVNDREMLIFGEIKTGKSGWAKAGADQISNTLRIFRSCHNLSDWSKTIAYVSNRRFWKARTSHRNTISEFWVQNRIPLRIQNEVVVE